MIEMVKIEHFSTHQPSNSSAALDPSLFNRLTAPKDSKGKVSATQEFTPLILGSLMKTAAFVGLAIVILPFATLLSFIGLLACIFVLPLILINERQL